jgi:vacuolar-type H+-ATPase catalytic subunit A/Vma1
LPKNHRIKRIINKETLINEQQKIREFLKKIDLQKQLEECKKLTGKAFDQHDIEMAQPNNKIKYEERTENIKEIQTKLLTEKITNNEEYIKNITQLGQKMKENIIYETFNNPEKFIKPEEIKMPNQVLWN